MALFSSPTPPPPQISHPGSARILVTVPLLLLVEWRWVSMCVWFGWVLFCFLALSKNQLHLQGMEIPGTVAVQIMCSSSKDSSQGGDAAVLS